MFELAQPAPHAPDLSARTERIGMPMRDEANMVYTLSRTVHSNIANLRLSISKVCKAIFTQYCFDVHRSVGIDVCSSTRKH